jgi:ubiquinol-cytochrome c reductase iron-sulfur subunit
VTGFAGLAAALAVPVFSLGPAPGRSLFETPWRRGLRLVGLDNQPVHADQLPIGGMLTVFPEGAPGSSDGQAVLIHVEPGLLALPGDGGAGAPNGYVCFSKKCTHAGCPVGLYRASDHQLVCPCHQSTFDVLHGAVPVFGPAVRPLPQLPIQQQPDGTFVANDGFAAPVGPSFWDVHSGEGA